MGGSRGGTRAISAFRQAAQKRRERLLSGESLEVEALKRQHLSRREPRQLARPQEAETPVRPIASFHADSRDGDLHRADMAWALHAAARGLCLEQIEHEILNSRDLSKKGPPLRRLAYAMRTASKATALSAQ